MKKHNARLRDGTMAAFMLAGCAMSRFVQAEEPTALAEVVVTAEKRAEKLQDVPMSITAFDEGALNRLGVNGFEDYAGHVPNLSFSQGSSTVFGGLYVAIRGVYGADTTGFYLDDTPIPQSLNPHLNDIARIEVLRGPQGTLFGARSMGGTVRIITNQPDVSALGGEAHATLSDTDHGSGNYSGDGVINIPLVPDVAALRFSAFIQSDSGVFSRVPGRQAALPPTDPVVPFPEQTGIGSSTLEGANLSGIVKMLDGTFSLKPQIAVQHNFLNGLPYADIYPGNFTQVRLFDIDEPQAEDWQHYSLTANLAFDAGSIVSSTALLRRTANESEDWSEVASLLFGTPPTPALMNYHETLARFAHETRFTSAFSGRTQLTAGIFYSDSTTTQVFPNNSIAGINDFYGGALGSDVVFDYRTVTTVKEVAAFAEVTVEISSGLKAILGARVFKNTVDFEGAESGAAVTPGTFSGSQTDHKTTPKMSIQYEFSQDAQIYATAAQGFRIGGVNAFSNSLCADDLAEAHLTQEEAQSYKSDSLWSYELGSKTSWLENRVTANVAAFYIDWSNVQQSVALPTCGFSVFVNAGTARSTGGELELNAAVATGLTFSAGLGYTDTEVTGNNGIPSIKVGQPLQQIPKWTATAALDYTFQVAGRKTFVHGDYGYTGSSLSANNDALDPRLRDSYDLVNLRSAMTFGKAELGIYAQNVFDKHANLSDTPPLAVELPGRPRIVTNRPRTIGLDMRVRF